MSAVLALDLGTKTGFAIARADGTIVSGERQFPARANEHDGARFARFEVFLEELHRGAPELRRVVFEHVVAISIPGRDAGLAAGQLYGGLLALVKLFAYRHQLLCDGFHITTIKKQFAGSGKAQKVDVINQCRALGFAPVSDNEADAIALLHVATDRCPLLTPCGASPKKRAPKPGPELVAGVDPF